MSYIGNTPGVSSQRVITEEVIAGAAKSAFYPIGGYSQGYVDVLVNGVEVDSSDFTANDGVLVTLINPAQVGETVKIKCYLPRGLSDGYLKSEADALLAGKLSNSAGAVGTANVADGAITAAKIAAGAIPASNDASALTTGTLPVARIADGTLTASKLGAGAAVANIGAGGVSANELAAAIKPLTVGQSWQDVTGSRAGGTTYTNSTGRAIAVNWFNSNAPSNGGSTVYINGVAVGGFCNYGTSGGGMIVVPAGATYSITYSGSSLIRWFELR